MGTSKLLGDNLTNCWEVTCDGLVSHPGGSRNTPSRFILRKPELRAGTDESSWLAQLRLGQTLPSVKMCGAKVFKKIFIEDSNVTYQVL